jgi:hypothetical protein
LTEKYTLERVYKVFDNESGAMIKISPDVDGLGLIELDGGDDYGRLTLPPELAGIVGHAILHCCDDVEFFQKRIEEKLTNKEKTDV